MNETRDHKKALVSAAIKLFRRHGYSGTGLNDILALSGAPKGSFYHYFPMGKTELGAAAVAAAGRAVSRTLRDTAAATRTTRAFLERYTELLAGWLEASGYQDGCPIATTLLETAPAEPGIAAAGQAAYDDHAAIIAGVLKRDGLTGARAARAAATVLASLQGALLLARVHKSDAPLRAVAETLPRALASATRTSRTRNATTS